MIVKFLGNKGGGSVGATIDYLLGKDRDRPGAVLLSGDPELTQRLADNLDFQNRYTVGVLSFEESDLEEHQKEAIMQSFEETLLAGLERDQYDITWIEHTDKGRLELNFVIPNVELSTGKRLQPYFDQADRPLVENWKQVTNFEHGLTDPHAPEKAQAIKTLNSQNLPSSVKEIKEQIGTAIAEQISSGNIQNRQDVVETLKGAGFEIARETDRSISIKNPDGKRNIRLEGVIYENRQFDKQFAEEHIQDHQPKIRNALRLNILTGAVLGVLITMFLIFLGVNWWLAKQIQNKQQELAEISLKVDQTPLEKQILRKVRLVESEDKKTFYIIAKNNKKADAYESTDSRMVLKLEK